MTTKKEEGSISIGMIGFYRRFFVAKNLAIFGNLVEICEKCLKVP